MDVSLENAIPRSQIQGQTAEFAAETRFMRRDRTVIEVTSVTEKEVINECETAPKERVEGVLSMCLGG